jgi:hypothetical protein
MQITADTKENPNKRLQAGPRHSQTNVNWNQVDWRKSGVQIANELGVCKSAVSAARKRLGKDPAVSDPTIKYACARTLLPTIDWRQPTYVVAKELQVPFHVAQYWRKMCGAQVSAKKQIIRRLIMTADWAKSDVQLHKETGAAISTIGNWRKRLGKPRSSGKNSKHSWENKDWTKQDCQLAEEAGVLRGTVEHWRKKLGKPQSPDCGLLRPKPLNAVEMTAHRLRQIAVNRRKYKAHKMQRTRYSRQYRRARKELTNLLQFSIIASSVQ